MSFNPQCRQFIQKPSFLLPLVVVGAPRPGGAAAWEPGLSRLEGPRGSSPRALAPLPLGYFHSTWRIKHAAMDVFHVKFACQSLRAAPGLHFLRCLEVTLGAPASLHGRSLTHSPIFLLHLMKELLPKGLGTKFLCCKRCANVSFANLWFPPKLVERRLLICCGSVGAFS